MGADPGEGCRGVGGGASPALLLQPSGLGGPDRLWIGFLACGRRWTAYPTYTVCGCGRSPGELVCPSRPPRGCAGSASRLQDGVSWHPQGGLSGRGHSVAAGWVCTG